MEPSYGTTNSENCENDRASNRQRCYNLAKGTYLFRIRPRWIGSYLHYWASQFQIWDIIRVELFGCHGQTRVNAVASGMRSNGVSLSRMAHRTNHRTPDLRIWVSP
jgi:hypothetical protein